MKAKVEITQKTLYTYEGRSDSYSDTLHLEFDNLNAAKDLVDAFPENEIADINVVMTVTLKDHDKRKLAEDGEGE
jgi:hypothetical protein